jgi:hypothetical protein
MAYYLLFPQIDSTIYSHPDRKLMNSGHDEILEIVKEKGSSDQKYYPSRILLKFKNEDIKDVITNKIGSTTFNNGTTEVRLKLFVADTANLASTLNLQTFAVSQSWDEGTGKYSNVPTSSNGVSWIYRDNSTLKTTWPTGSSNIMGLTHGSSSIILEEMPTGSQTQLTVNGIDIIPVLSSSLFNFSTTEKFVNIDATPTLLTDNIVSLINASSSLFGVTASKISGDNITIHLSGSTIGSVGNVPITTGSITGNSQPIFTLSGSLSASLSVYDTQGGTSVTSLGFAPGTTGSIRTDQLTQGGGTWYTGSNFTSTQQFLNGDSLDTNFDVTATIKLFSSSIFSQASYPLGISNNGFIIKHPDTVEANPSASVGDLQYFSVDTHTIFPPHLAFKWDDSVHNYQSTSKKSGSLNINLYNNRKEYNQNDEALIRIHVRDKYPNRTLTTTSNYLNINHLTTSSYYSVRDAYTEEEVIPFDDNFTKLSADSEGMYFKLYMKGLQPERYYRILFKHTNNDGTTIYDDDYHFKVIR